MDDNKAIAILMNLKNKYKLSGEEQEAIKAAIGILTWSVLGKSRIRSRKSKLEKDTKW
jgi:hypothetical protein